MHVVAPFNFDVPLTFKLFAFNKLVPDNPYKLLLLSYTDKPEQLISEKHVKLF